MEPKKCSMYSKTPFLINYGGAGEYSANTILASKKPTSKAVTN